MPDLTIAPSLTLWRAFVPRWAHRPLSGEGASRFGGRWNPVGTPTLYAALELSTAWAEYNQGFVQHPALIARLELTSAALCDLRDEGMLHELGADVSIHAVQWRDDLERGKVPKTHIVARRLLAEGHHGVIYPSVMSNGGSCVALWRWNSPGGPALNVIDPEGRLPKNAASWS